MPLTEEQERRWQHTYIKGWQTPYLPLHNLFISTFTLALHGPVKLPWSVINTKHWLQYHKTYREKDRYRQRDRQTERKINRTCNSEVYTMNCNEQIDCKTKSSCTSHAATKLETIRHEIVASFDPLNMIKCKSLQPLIDTNRPISVHAVRSAISPQTTQVINFNAQKFY